MEDEPRKRQFIPSAIKVRKRNVRLSRVEERGDALLASAPRMEKREFHGRRRVGSGSTSDGTEKAGCTIRSLRRDREIEPGIARRGGWKEDGRPNYETFQPSGLRSTMRNDRQDRKMEKHEAKTGRRGTKTEAERERADGRTTILRRQGAPSRDIIHLQGIILLLAGRGRRGCARARARTYSFLLPFSTLVLLRALALLLALLLYSTS